jgi:predicted Zn finger-like uncharacterized protein
MKVQCGQCPAKYAIADERIHGKKVRIRCKRCGAAIVVDGKVDPPLVTSEPSTQAVSDSVPPSSPRPEAKTMLGGLEAPAHFFEKKSPAAASPARAAARSATPVGVGRIGMPASGRGLTEPPAALNGKASWRVAMTENDLRWMTTAEVIEAFRTGVVKPETFVLKEGMSHWQTLLEVDELADALGEDADPLLINGKGADDGASPHPKMTKLGLGLDLDQPPSSSKGGASDGTHARVPQLDESFLTLPFTDAEPIDSLPAPKAATPLPSPLLGRAPFEPPTATPSFERVAAPAPPMPQAPQPEAPAFGDVARPASSGSLWPWLLAVVVVAAAVAAAVVFAR